MTAAFQALRWYSRCTEVLKIITNCETSHFFAAFSILFNILSESEALSLATLIIALKTFFL